MYVTNIFYDPRNLHRVRFIKGCRQKVRWINVGIDIQDIIRFGIRSDTGILGADDDDDEFHNLYVM
jgi:hypothetical protein